MIIDKNNEEARHKALMDAFKDPAFQASLEPIRDELQRWLEKWADELPMFDPRIKNVASIESRIKGETTFEEKLFRKDYVKEWDVSDDKVSNQELIKRTLTDLIGLRVNCQFYEHELLFYNHFIRTRSSQEEKGFSFSFDENTEQKNGNRILKFSGIYKDKVHFEVQIKSLLHAVWGEIEHKTVYKNPTYDGFFEDKKLISQTLHESMMASDKELLILFKMNETEEQLLRSLFFCETSDEVARACKTSVLGEHYNSYFLSFKDIEVIKRYLVCKLSGNEFKREAVQIEDSLPYQGLIEAVKNTFPSFFLKCLYHIDSILHIHSSYDSFLLYFLKNVTPLETDLVDDGFGRPFNEQDDDEDKNKESSKDDYRAFLIRIDGILGTRVFKNETE